MASQTNEGDFVVVWVCRHFSEGSLANWWEQRAQCTNAPIHVSRSVSVYPNNHGTIILGAHDQHTLLRDQFLSSRSASQRWIDAEEAIWEAKLRAIFGSLMKRCMGVCCGDGGAIEMNQDAVFCEWGGGEPNSCSEHTLIQWNLS
jgi:hypothetical protein